MKRNKKLNQLENEDIKDNTFTQFSEEKRLTNKEKKKLQYEERIRKKKEKQLKKVKKLLKKNNLGSLKDINRNLINNVLLNEEDETKVILKNDENKFVNEKNKIKKQTEELRDNIKSSNENENEVKSDRRTETKKGSKNICSIENLPNKKLIKKLKNKLKQDKELEKKKLFKKIEHYKLSTNERNLMVHFNIKAQNKENLEKLFKTYEERNIELSHNMKILKCKLEKKKKRFLENKKDEGEKLTKEKKKKMKVSKTYNDHNKDGECYNKDNILNCNEDSIINYNENENILDDQIIKENKSVSNIKGNEISEKSKKEEIKMNDEKRKIIYNRVNINRKEEIEKLRLSLPVLSYEQEIIEAILNYDVVFISGDTGCGKSTQIPQFLYEHGFSSSNYLIGITEPRKIAVKSLSHRLNEELNENVVGYQIRYEKSNLLKNSKIKVMTEGILLKEIMNDFILSKYSSIILDEAHERSINMDLILGLLSIICKIRKNNYFNNLSDVIPIKVIIMSATIDDKTFFENQIFENYTSINIPTQKVPVVDHFLSYTPKDYIEEARKKIIQIHKKLPPGSILVFLTGQDEIYHLYNSLKNLNLCKKSENAHSQKFNEEKKNIEDENLYSFDLSEEEKNMNDKTSFFFRNTDEDKEKKVIFDVSDDESVFNNNLLNLIQSNENDNLKILEKNLLNFSSDILENCKKNYTNEDIKEKKTINQKNDYITEHSDKEEENNLGKIKNENDLHKSKLTETKETFNEVKELQNSENEEKKNIKKEEKIEDKENKEEKNENGESDKELNKDSESEEETKKYNESDKELNKDSGSEEDISEHQKGKKKIDENVKKNSSIWKGSDGSGVLKIYKLYANLPMNEQMVLFNNPKDDERICILSTNIAETSITLPNIRYVVDCGKEKKKLYSTLNDYSYYVIDNISKSSSLQRKGRAGRILYLLKKNKKNKKKIEMEKGHVYKLYSSNYYNYFFKNNNDFPILNYPLDSLILYLLSFNIKNVENFPFINKPDKYKFEEAKKRLIYLNCIYFGYKDIEFLFKNVDNKMCSKKNIKNHVEIFNPCNKSGITLIGNLILFLPISTRYAKILSEVCLKSLAINHKRSIPLACLLVSCLYMESIFSYDYKLNMKYKKKEKKKKNNNNLVNLILKKDNDKKMENTDITDSCNESSCEEDSSSLKDYDDHSNNNVLENFKLKFDNDIDFYLNICTDFYFSKEKQNFCDLMKLDKKKMGELLKLSHYLMKIINLKFNTSINFDILEKNISPLSKQIIHYAIIQGFIDHLAIRYDLIHNDYSRNSYLSFNNKKAYFTQNINNQVYINSNSVLYKNRPYPKYILYNYIMKNKNTYTMFDCLSINDSDLGKITNVCIFINEYEKLPPAKYNKERDKISVYIKPLYLPCSHYLSITEKELNENDFLYYNYFALFILDGSIFPKILKFQIYYSHSSNDIINCEKQNIKEFIDNLKNNNIINRSTLINKWKIQKNFLKQEFISLIEKKCNKYHYLIDNFWPPLD
ncbi:DEAD/DEAH box ATP-dependent RNA helicase, putative [Plasmodium gallinaceum]|uniref:RNA helicase n=1 Tax=Plasmodium gallinaceum TaxID=5849 RepID=A0A1J1GYM4_PLAGA|nr:DEAD/DEAH box ATP-dependent RNA helicase, putative [Plasmodium gallinaceum]CRG97415.1 DEAD/DEAH box ATP-dependent RNA helicase, putative [Plasmodium gallinaceum]